MIEVYTLKKALRRITQESLIPANRVTYSGNIDQFAKQLTEIYNTLEKSKEKKEDIIKQYDYETEGLGGT